MAADRDSQMNLRAVQVARLACTDAAANLRAGKKQKHVQPGQAKSLALPSLAQGDSAPCTPEPQPRFYSLYHTFLKKTNVPRHYLMPEETGFGLEEVLREPLLFLQESIRRDLHMHESGEGSGEALPVL